LFFAAVMTCAATGGLGPGLFAIALAAAAADFFLTPPFYRFAIADRTQFLGLTLFVTEGTFICLLCEQLRRAVQRASASESRSKWLERRALQASDRERARIGRDLHDGLGQQLLGVTLLARAAEIRMGDTLAAPLAPARAVEDLRKIGQVVGEALQWTRDLARQLVAATLPTDGLAQALQGLASNAERLFGIRCFASAEPDLAAAPQGAAEHLYRIAQEAISNAVKHGHASSITICLSTADRSLGGDPSLQVLEIRDDGIGFDPRAAAAADHGTGLHLMRCRAEMIGGQLEVASPAGGPPGIVVRCTYPVLHRSAHLEPQP
jgi:signal transduction histidine kinase